jgi:outer membrane protein assembly factor BamB
MSAPPAPKARLRRPAVLAAFSLAAAACAGATVRRDEGVPQDQPARVVEMRWRAQINERGLFAARPEECATGAIVGDRLILGSRAGVVVALRISDGRILWSTSVSGAVDSETLYDERHGQVYVGTDDGTLYAMDPSSGAVRWSHRSKGAIERRPTADADSVYVATAADRVFALDARTGKQRWQYDREPPEGFTIHGHAGPRLMGNLLLAGFSDGFLVALRPTNGEVAWARSLAAASEQYVDVDSTPVPYRDLVVASSYSGGLYAVAATNGDVRWRVGVEGAGTVQVAGDRFFFAAPREGLTALTPEGQILWRQGLAQAGDLTPPQEAGRYLLFTGSRAGLFVVNRTSGALLQLFNPGRGMCAAPALDADRRTAYVLANSGWVYALQISP